MADTVVLSILAEKQVKKLPKYIKEALYVWVLSIGEEGIRSIRKLPGYHDEPLKGKRKGQRSVRLSKAYRVIYEECSKTSEIVIRVVEVNKHDY